MAFKGDPAAIGEGRSQPLRVFLRRSGRSHPKRQTIGHAACQIVAGQLITPLFGTPPAKRDDGAEIAIAGTVLRQQNQLHAAGQNQLRTDNQLEPCLLGRHMRPHNAGDRTFVGNGQSAIAQRFSLLDQLLRMRSTAQKAEVRHAVQLGVIGKRSLHEK